MRTCVCVYYNPSDSYIMWGGLFLLSASTRTMLMKE